MMSVGPDRHLRAEAHGRVLLLYGPKAGVGASVIACNLALALQTIGVGPVILVDANLELGSVATLMGLDVPAGRPEATELDQLLLRHPSGVLVLPATGQGGASHPITLADLDRLVAEARAHARFVVVDIQSGIEPFGLPLVRHADRILVVVTPESAAVRHAHAFLKLAAEQQLADRVAVVVNRDHSDSGLPAEQLAAAFGDRLVSRLGSYGAFVLQGVNTGRLFVEADPDHPLSRSVLDLARTLASA